MAGDDEVRMARLRLSKRNAEVRGDARQLATICCQLGDYYEQARDYVAAVAEREQELAAWTRLDLKLHMATANRRIGECLALKGEFDEAQRRHRAYLELAKEAGDGTETQRALFTIGRTYYMQADAFSPDSDERLRLMAAAKDAYGKSLAACERLQAELKRTEYLAMRGRLLLNVGLLCDMSGDQQKAVGSISEAARLLRENKQHEDVYLCEASLSDIYYRSGNVKHALRFADAASMSARRDPERKRVREALVAQAKLLVETGQMLEALRCLMRAGYDKLPTGGADDDEYGGVSFTKSACRMKLLLDNIETTKLAAQPNQCELARLHEKLGDLAARAGCFRASLDHYNRCMTAMRAAGKPAAALAPIYVSLAETSFDLCDYKRASDYYLAELECRGSGERAEIAGTLMSVADCLARLGKSRRVVGETYGRARSNAVKSGDGQLLLSVCKAWLAFLVKRRDVDSDCDDVDDDSGDAEDEDDRRSMLEVEIATLESSLAPPAEDSDLIVVGSSSDDDDDDSFFGDVQLSALVGNYEDAKSGQPLVAEIDIDEKPGDGEKKPAVRFNVNGRGEFPLHVACIRGDLVKVKKLLVLGHPTMVRDFSGWTPLHEACNFGHVDVVEFLLDMGADIDDRGGWGCDGLTPLQDAAILGHLDVVELLVRRGANVLAKNDLGETALDCLLAHLHKRLSAAERKHVRAVEKLLRKAAAEAVPVVVTPCSAADAAAAADADSSQKADRVAAKAHHTTTHATSPGSSCDEQEVNSRIRQRAGASRRLAAGSSAAAGCAPSTSDGQLERRRRLKQAARSPDEEPSSSEDSQADGSVTAPEVAVGYGADAAARASMDWAGSCGTEQGSGQEAYRAAIASVRRSALRPVLEGRRKAATAREARALAKSPPPALSSSYARDDWLVDDTKKATKARKKRKLDAPFLGSCARRSSPSPPSDTLPRRGAVPRRRRLGANLEIDDSLSAVGLSVPETPEAECAALEMECTPSSTSVAAAEAAATKTAGETPTRGRSTQPLGLATRQLQRDFAAGTGTSAVALAAAGSPPVASSADGWPTSAAAAASAVTTPVLRVTNEAASSRFAGRSTPTLVAPTTSPAHVQAAPTTPLTGAGSLLRVSVRFGATVILVSLPLDPGATVAQVAEDARRRYSQLASGTDAALLAAASSITLLVDGEAQLLPGDLVSSVLRDGDRLHAVLAGPVPATGAAAVEAAAALPGAVAAGSDRPAPLQPLSLADGYAVLCLQRGAPTYENVRSELAAADRHGRLLLAGFCASPATAAMVVESLGLTASAHRCIAESLVELDLSCNRLGDGGAERLAGVLTLLVGLRRLDVSSNEIGTAGAAHLARPFGADGSAPKPLLQALEALMVSYNSFDGVDAAEHLATLVAGLPRLRVLHAAACGLGVNAVGHRDAPLCRALKSRACLDVVDLSSNVMGSLGVKCIVKHALSMRVLRSLDLSGAATDGAAETVAGAEEESAALVSAAAAPTLKSPLMWLAASGAPLLESLCLAECDLTEADARELALLGRRATAAPPLRRLSLRGNRRLSAAAVTDTVRAFELLVWLDLSWCRLDAAGGGGAAAASVAALLATLKSSLRSTRPLEHLAVGPADWCRRALAAEAGSDVASLVDAWRACWTSSAACSWHGDVLVLSKCGGAAAAMLDY